MAQELPRATMPLWLRAALAAERGASRAVQALSALVEELALACVAPRRRDAVTAAIYAAQRMYLPGSARFEQGLTDWERAGIAAPQFPRAGHLLLGGAGGGREVRALLALGYSVLAFEPNARLAEQGRRALAGTPATMLRASYADMVLAAAGVPGPLADAVRARPIDGVVLGWASLSHVMDAADRLALLRAARTLAPAAPVFLSFMVLGAGSEEARAGRARRVLRRTLAALGAPGRARPGDRFLPWGGFVQLLGVDDVRTLASDAGYRVAILEATPYGHALLVPAPVSSADPAR